MSDLIDRRPLAQGTRPDITRMFAREPGLTAVGLAGLVAASVCLVAVVVLGRSIAPEGKPLDAVTFTFGVGIFMLTMALVLPLAGWSDAARRRCRLGFSIFAVYGLVVESVQSFRGLDPRFSDAGGPIDVVIGAVFGVTALIMTAATVVLACRFFRADVLTDRLLLRLGIRYGFAAVLVSFAIGILMSALSGRTTGTAGNLLPAHALGVHGIQAMPIAALLIAAAPGVFRRAALVHVAGIGWLLACAGALAQALVGRAPSAPSVFSALVVAGLVSFVVAVGLPWATSVRRH